MGKTRFMTVLFSASENGDEELTNQVAEDIQAAKENGSYEDEDGEMTYQDLGDRGVLATDNGTGEHTLIHNNVVSVGDDVVIDLEEIPDYCVENLVHPEVDVENQSMIVNPMDEAREFSVATDNTAVLRIFSDQDLVETVTESMYHSEQEAQVGDLKFEKDSESDGIIVTDMSSGDKAKVELEGEDMKVTELDQKNFKYFSNNNMEVVRRKVFSNAEQYEPIFVVGMDPVNKVLVNSPVYGEAAAEELAGMLAERGLVGIQIFADPDEGRDYSLQLLECDGAVDVEPEEEMEVSYSDVSVIGNRYYSDRTRFMNRLFSEAEDEVADHQELIEDAIEDGDQLETEDFIITPVDDQTAVVEDKDNGEFTVAELDGEDINVEAISEDEAEGMMEEAEKSYTTIFKGRTADEWDAINNSAKKSRRYYEDLFNTEYKGVDTEKEADRIRKLRKADKANKIFDSTGDNHFERSKFYDKARSEAKGMTKGNGGLISWVKKNPKLAAGIGAGVLAAGGAGAYALNQRNNSEYDERNYTTIFKGRTADEWDAINKSAKKSKRYYEDLFNTEYKGVDTEKEADRMRKLRKADKANNMFDSTGDNHFERSKFYDKARSEAAYDNKSKLTKKVDKITAWAKKNPKMAAGVGVGALLAGGAGAYYGLRQKEESDRMYSDDATIAQIEDSATEAIQNVQEAANMAIEAINQAKTEPVESLEDVREATYSDRSFSDTEETLYNPTLSELEW